MAFDHEVDGGRGVPSGARVITNLPPSYWIAQLVTFVDKDIVLIRKVYIHRSECPNIPRKL